MSKATFFGHKLTFTTDISEKSDFQMGFELTILRDPVGCSDHRDTGDSMMSKAEMVVFDWNRIVRSHS